MENSMWRAGSRFPRGTPKYHPSWRHLALRRGEHSRQQHHTPSKRRYVVKERWTGTGESRRPRGTPKYHPESSQNQETLQRGEHSRQQHHTPLTLRHVVKEKWSGRAESRSPRGTPKYHLAS